MIDRRLFALGAAALLAGCRRGPDLNALIPGEEAKVASVRSGEVLTLTDGLEVRLAGIEGPNGAEPLADEAMAALEALVIGKSVQLRYGGLRRDRYERALAHIIVGGAWAQGKLLEAGLARVRTYSDNRALAADMLRAEAAARAERKGLWALDVYQVRLPREAAALRGFQIVEGTVSAARPGGDGFMLDFMDDGVRGEIPVFAAEDFKAAGKGPDALAGKLIRIRGTLSGRRIRLDHPETVELLRAG